MVKDLGKFDEGNCSQINGLDEILVVCFADNRLANAFLSQCSTNAAKFNTNANDVVNFETQLSERDSAILVDYPVTGPDGLPINGKIGSGLDVVSSHSYWRLMNNWGQCSKACDGGESTR